MRVPAPLHFLGARLPESASVRLAVCMGSGPEPQIAAMLATVRRLFPGARLVLLCDAALGGVGEDERITLAELARARRERLAELAARRPDVGAILIGSDWAYWRQWLVGGMVGARSYLICNEHGDAYFAARAGIPRLCHQLLQASGVRHPRRLWTAPLRAAELATGMAWLALSAWTTTRRRRAPATAFEIATPRALGWQPEPERAAGSPEQGAAVFTGERFVPGVDPDLEMEHLARYRFALGFAVGRRVLDLGCGEGYGAALLGLSARSVVGCEIDAGAVARAAAAYRHANLCFVHVGATGLLPFASGSYDLVTAFEVIEHVPDPDRLLDEARRLLAPGGILIVSSPNRPYYRMERNEVNPYHVHEFDLPELRDALQARFREVRIFGENHVAGILIDDLGADIARIESEAASTGRELATAHYLMGVASDAPIPEHQSLLYLDLRGNQMREREREIRILRRELARARDAYQHLEREFQDRTRWALELDAQLHARRAPIHPR
ncbi:MAG: class I SAM-dependent methyltransferase [Planctomycetes bacterium]|nr:class I SAM-dependent methyltransferase [Planctomycetota bacterium]